MIRLSFRLALPVVAAFAFAGAAAAHPKLVSSTPAADAVVAGPTKIELTFSEKLVPQFSGVDLMMTGMPGMANHAPMKMTGLKTAVAADGKTLVTTMPRPLSAGAYTLNWHAVAGDTHRITGSFKFSVK